MARWNIALLCAFFVALLGLMRASSHVDFSPGLLRFSHDVPHVTSGDEPHYLLVVNSLLFDHDLELQADYGRVARGGAQAGRGFERNNLDHHTIVVDPRTRRHALWGQVFDWGRPLAGEGFARTDPTFPDDSIERSAHPVLFPVVVAALLAPLRPSGPLEVELLMADAVLLFAWAGMILTYLVARWVGLERGWALLATVLLLCCPWLAYSRSFFSEPLLGLLLLGALAALVRERLAFAGALVAAAAAIKAPFVLVGVAWALDLWARSGWRKALPLSIGMGVGVIALIGFNEWQTHTLIASGNTGWDGLEDPAKALDTLFDSGHGLLAFAPWALLPLGALEPKLRPARDPSSLLRTIGVGILPMFVLLVAFRNLGQTCYACRYWIPFFPWLAVGTSLYLREQSRVTRWMSACVIAWSAVVAVSGLLAYRNMWDKPPLTVVSEVAAGVRARANR